MEVLDIYRNGYHPHNIHFVVTSAQMAGDAETALDYALYGLEKAHAALGDAEGARAAARRMRQASIHGVNNVAVGRL